MDEFNPLVVHPVVYVLGLEDGCYYVGITFNFNHRMSQHFGGFGSKWTTLHKPVKLETIIFPGSKARENEMTLQMMEKHGIEKVRGGKWCTMATPKLTGYDIEYISSVDGPNSV